MELDSSEIIKINKEIRYEYDLYEGKELTEELIDEIRYVLGLRHAYGLISKKDYTQKEMSLKLYERNIDKKTVSKIIEKLVKEKYIDDENYTKTYIEYKTYSLRRIIFELSKKGISKEKIKNIYNLQEKKEKDRIIEHLKKLENKTKEQKISYLIRQGFLYEDIIEMI